MATRLIGTDDADPRLPALVVAATQGATAADLAPGDILDSLAATQTWASPIASGITVGNGTTVARYAQVGNVVVAALNFTLGTSSAVTGSVVLALPAAEDAVSFRGVCSYTDTSATTTYGGLTNANALRAINTSATYATHAALSATIPFTWASTDIINVTLTYLAA